MRGSGLSARRSNPTNYKVFAILATVLCLAFVGVGQASAQCPSFAYCTAYAAGTVVSYNGSNYTAGYAISATRDCSAYTPAGDNWWNPGGTCGTSTPTPTPKPTNTPAATSTPTAKPTKAVILRQPPGSAQRLQVPVDVKKIITLKSDDLELQRNDILYVPDSTGKHALRRSAEIAIAIATGAAIIRVE